MCPLQVEQVYCLQASWQGRGEPPEVDHNIYVNDYH